MKKEEIAEKFDEIVSLISQRRLLSARKELRILKEQVNNEIEEVEKLCKLHQDIQEQQKQKSVPVSNGCKGEAKGN